MKKLLEWLDGISINLFTIRFGGGKPLKCSCIGSKIREVLYDR